MNKTEFITAVAEKSGLSKADAKKAVDAFVGAIKQNNTTTDAYGKIMKAKVASAKDTAAKSKVDDSSDYELGMQIAKKFNPHYKEEN